MGSKKWPFVCGKKRPVGVNTNKDKLHNDLVNNDMQIFASKNMF